MIDLYYWTTPNGHKMTMFLEEVGLPYTIHPVNIGKGEQFDPAFLKISPNNHHFGLYAPEKIPYAIDRYVRETGRLYAVLNKKLCEREFIVGEYSIADIASYPWIRPERQQQNIDDFPHLKRWQEAIQARPATVRLREGEGDQSRRRHSRQRRRAQGPVRSEQGHGALTSHQQIDTLCSTSKMRAG